MLKDADKRMLSELASFCTESVWDSHSHIYRRSDLGSDISDFLSNGPETCGIGAWRESMAAIHGSDHIIGGLFFPYPAASCDAKKANNFLLGELSKESSCRGGVLVTPSMTEGDIESFIDNPRIVALKPYHVFSNQKPSFDSTISGFLTKGMLEVAHRHSLAIVLHLVRKAALADPENLKEIIAISKKYQNVKLVLAHAGRGFHAQNTVKAVRALRGCTNVWFDVSGICEPEAIVAILKEFGPRRLLWGSDFPVSEMRGRAVSIGDGFFWLTEESLSGEKLIADIAPNLVKLYLESLHALQSACSLFGASSDDRKDIFSRNALDLFGIERRPAGISQSLYVHAKKRIPGGTQLLSKRPENMCPNQWPPYYREARGCEIWDLDGRHYYDMSTNGIGACLLGFADPDVNDAVIRRVNLGSASTLNLAEEVELADLLCSIHPWASQARFTRAGGETGAVAVRIARATTDRSVVAFCGYHGWHDWYLSANLGESDALRGHLLPGLNPFGVPRELRGTAFPFTYNNIEEFERIIDAHGENLACVVMEPCRGRDPEPGFLEYVRDEAHRVGALLIFDEVTIGFRRNFGGSHLALGVNPDIAFFAKALANGFPIGAVIGTAEAMEGAHISFISSTSWTEGVGPAAALASVQKLKAKDVSTYIAKIGNLVCAAWKRSAEHYGLPVEFDGGYPCLAHFKFDHPESEALRTLYTQLMLDRGFLAGVSIYPTLAHTEEIVALYAEAVDEVFKEIATVIHGGNIQQALKGPVALSGFKRLLS